VRELASRLRARYCCNPAAKGKRQRSRSKWRVKSRRNSSSKASLRRHGRQKAAVSLEVARQITTKFEQQGFTPPPRTIADITAILDEEKPDPEKLAASKAKADAQPPPDLEGPELAAFYYDRGIQAGLVGRDVQRLEDLRKAVALLAPSKETQVVAYDLYLSQAANAAALLLHMQEQAKWREEEITLLESHRPTLQRNLIIAYMRMATLAADQGDFRGAEAWLSKADQLDRSLLSGHWHPYVEVAQAYEMQLDGVHGSILASRGQFSEADSYFVRAVRTAELYPQITGDTPQPNQQRYVAYAQHARNLAALGRLVEAEAEARRALLGEIHTRGGDVPGSVETFQAALPTLSR
jgi:tetratricopeptide (TPR) repeat protein